MTTYKKIKYYLFHQNRIVLAITFGWAIFSLLAHLESVIRAPNGRIIPGVLLLGAMTFVFNVPLMLLIFRILERLVELLGRWRGYVILLIAFVLEGVIYSGSKVPSTPVVGLFLGALAMTVLMTIALVLVKGKNPFVSENFYTKKTSDSELSGSIIKKIKPFMNWKIGAGGVSIVALFAFAFVYLQHSGFKGSVDELYESGRTKQINFENYEAWVAQDMGVEVFITNLACNSDGSGSLLLGRFTTDGREVKACWKLDDKGVGIVSLTGQAKRIRPEAFTLHTLNGMPVNKSLISGGPPLVDKEVSVGSIPEAVVMNRSATNESTSPLSAKYSTLHESKSYAEWSDDDMISAVNLLANPVTQADRKWLKISEEEIFNERCSTGSCEIQQQEFAAARKLRDGKARSPREALGLTDAAAMPAAQNSGSQKASGTSDASRVNQPKYESTVSADPSLSMGPMQSRYVDAISSGLEVTRSTYIPWSVRREKIIAILSTPVTPGDWKYIDVRESKLGNCNTKDQCDEEEAVRAARVVREGKGLKRPSSSQ